MLHSIRVSSRVQPHITSPLGYLLEPLGCLLEYKPSTQIWYDDVIYTVSLILSMGSTLPKSIMLDSIRKSSRVQPLVTNSIRWCNTHSYVIYTVSLILSTILDYVTYTVFFIPSMRSTGSCCQPSGEPSPAFSTHNEESCCGPTTRRIWEMRWARRE